MLRMFLIALFVILSHASECTVANDKGNAQCRGKGEHQCYSVKQSWYFPQQILCCKTMVDLNNAMNAFFSWQYPNCVLVEEAEAKVAVADESPSGSSFWLWLIAALTLINVGGAIYIYRKRKFEQSFQQNLLTEV